MLDPRIDQVNTRKPTAAVAAEAASAQAAWSAKAASAKWLAETASAETSSAQASWLAETASAEAAGDLEGLADGAPDHLDVFAVVQRLVDRPAVEHGQYMISRHAVRV